MDPRKQLTESKKSSAPAAPAAPSTKPSSNSGRTWASAAGGLPPSARRNSVTTSNRYDELSSPAVEDISSKPQTVSFAPNQPSKNASQRTVASSTPERTSGSGLERLSF
jgi:hypothetical protein